MLCLVTIDIDDRNDVFRQWQWWYCCYDAMSHCCGCGKIAKSLMGWTDEKSLQGALDGKDNISNAARARAGVVVATRSRHEFSMVYVR